MIDIIQINLKKAFVATVELNKTIKRLGEYIILATEPYKFKGKLRSVPPKANTICGSEPRAAIIYGNGIELIKVDHLTNKDCAVGLLNDPVPKGYKVYPLLKPEPALGEKLKGEFVLVTDQNRRLFVHEVGQISKLTNGYSHITLRYDASKKIGYGKVLVRGDSGNPSFVMVKGEPVLIETHHGGGAGAGPFYGDVDLHEKLKAAIQALGGSGSIRTVAWR